MSSCTNPILCWYPTDENGEIVDGVQPVFRWDDVTDNNWIQSAMRCNKCDSCASHYKNQWAVRCAMEMHFHKQSCCLTLTYDEEHLPENEMLCKKDMQNFMKRYRDHLKRNLPDRPHPFTGEMESHKIRYIYCGEYGSNGGRPHYHVLVFGHDFDDKQPYNRTKSGVQYQSDVLDELWGNGIATIGEGGMEAAHYVAGYIAKKLQTEKINGKNFTVDKSTGEIIFKDSEFLEMSRRPAIGRWFYDKWRTDIYPADEVVLINNGRAVTYPVPTYFDKCLKEEYPELWQKVKAKRLKNAVDYAIRNPDEKSFERMRVKAFIRRKEQNEKSRGYDGIVPNYHVDMLDVDQKHKVSQDYQREIKNKSIFAKIFGKNDENLEHELDQKIEAVNLPQKMLENDENLSQNHDENRG